MERLTLNDLEKLTGIKAATIRVWERRYRIIKPNRTVTNRRWYDNDDVTSLINISILYRNGIKISKIALLSNQELAEKAASLATESFDAGIQIDSLATAMISFNENAVNEILLRSIINIGFEETFTSVIFPFLRRVGMMWHTGKVNVGAEHFISNIFRRKLFSAIDTLTPPVIPGRKRLIMYLPEDEFHDLGLLFYTYLIRRMGHDVMYLGQSTPFDTLSVVNDNWHADYFVTGLQSGLPFIKPEDYLKSLSEKFNKQKILVSGSLAVVAERHRFSNVFILRSVSDLKFII
jgi:DNA-binding transcriptional MerR regulator